VLHLSSTLPRAQVPGPCDTNTSPPQHAVAARHHGFAGASASARARRIRPS
jgi:hypothetical protein